MAAAAFSAQVRIAGDDAALQGHFPGAPAVPAARLLGYVQRTLDAAGLRLAGIERVKFLRPVGPGDVVDVHVAAQPDGRASMLLRVGDDTVATGTCLSMPA